MLGKVNSLSRTYRSETTLSRYLGDLCRSEVSAGEAAIAQLERDLEAAQAKLGQAESKLAAAQDDAAEKDKVIKCVMSHVYTVWLCTKCGTGDTVGGVLLL